MKVVYAALLAVWCVVPASAEDFANMAEPNAMPAVTAPQVASDEWMNNPESSNPESAIIPAGGVTIAGHGRVVENTTPDGNVQVEIRGAPARGGVRTIPVYRGKRDRQKIRKALAAHGIDPNKVERLSQLRQRVMDVQDTVRKDRTVLYNLINKVNTRVYPELKTLKDKNTEQDERLTKLENAAGSQVRTTPPAQASASQATNTAYTREEVVQHDISKHALIYLLIIGLAIAGIVMALRINRLRSTHP